MTTLLNGLVWRNVLASLCVPRKLRKPRFEVRQYTVDKARVGTGTFNGSINELHQRFREQEVAIFKKHGAGVWQHLGNPDALVWMLAYRDRAHRDDVWAKFAADPDWKAVQQVQRADWRERVPDERHGLFAAEIKRRRGDWC